MVILDEPADSRASACLTVFVGEQLVARGDLASAVRAAYPFADTQTITAFDDATGRVVDLDLRGSADEAAARVAPREPSPKPARGRPKLGVTAREITLLPRHWAWLASQPGGASAALRRLVDSARRESVATDAARQAQEAAYRVMTVLAGNLPGYEEAARALFAGNRDRLSDLIAAWPKDISAYVGELAGASSGNPSP
jgi:hypothetical protein